MLKKLSIRNILKISSVVICVSAAALFIVNASDFSLAAPSAEGVNDVGGFGSAFLFSLSLVLMVFNKPSTSYHWLFWAGIVIHAAGLIMCSRTFISEDHLESWNLLTALFILGLGVSMLFLNGLGSVIPTRAWMMEISTFTIVVSTLVGCGVFIMAPGSKVWFWAMCGLGILVLLTSTFNIILSSPKK